MSIAERTGLLTVEEYLKLAERDVFRDRVELIEGEIVSMSPQGVLHARIIMLLAAASIRHSIPAERLAVSCTLQLQDTSALEPDFIILRDKQDIGRYYAAADALLVVEVSISTQARDRSKLPLYAASGIPEVWLLLPEERRIEVHTGPTAAGYQHRRELKPGDVLETAAVPGLRLAVGPLLDGKEPTA